MAPMTRAKSANRYRYCVASLRSEDTETAFEDTANAAADDSSADDSSAPLDSIEPVDRLESAEALSTARSPVVQPEWNGRRPRSTRFKSFSFQYMNRRRRGGVLPTRDELDIAAFLVSEDFRSEWVLRSAVVTMVQMKIEGSELFCSHAE